MLEELLRKLNNDFPEHTVLFRAIKQASVAHGVLLIRVINQAQKEMINENLRPEIIRIAREIDHSVRELRIVNTVPLIRVHSAPSDFPSGYAACHHKH